MIMCVLLCYPVSIRIYYQQGGLFLVRYCIFMSQGIRLEFMNHIFIFSAVAIK